ncbi:germination protein YpeB [Paenibacillus sp. EKM202P]|uniref:germination protein YpeB n=1 Tax=Paenibacillus TaxID=44249 RepID=UPI0013EDA3CC|nr:MULTISPECIES: germination protein YpeB [unclassified Paenibacillus]KAF6563001.1 germination protein YpeB [Paenibacillus sp. EKM202P]KAF6569728.1 germination protein YpeB [Paenibacillus sp. EKM207P]
MYKRLSAVLFPVVTLIMIGAFVWGYQQSQMRREVSSQANRMSIKAENQYQRAFHDLSFHMDQLHSQLGNAVAVHTTSHAMHRKCLMNVWRIASEAQNEVNQLPLNVMPFNHAKDLLSHLSAFSYQTAVRDLDHEPLNEKEISNLKTLYNNSKEISKNMHEVQQKVISKNLRWMDVDMAAGSQTGPKDNTIIDGFKTVDKKVENYKELDWGPSVASIYDKRSVKKLSLPAVDAGQIKRNAAEFTGKPESQIRVNENGKGTEWASYTATLLNKQQPVATMDFTKKGGKLISYHDMRSVGPKKATRNEAVRYASDYLEQRGYKGMKPVAYDESGNLANITFASQQGDVIIYPEKITVRSGLDNGQVIGFQCSDYVYEHSHLRRIPQAKLNLNEARAKLNPEFRETYHRKALIENELSNEVLCYEFGGKINGSIYRIYINANTGMEETIEQVKDSDEAQVTASNA